MKVLASLSTSLSLPSSYTYHSISKPKSLRFLQVRSQSCKDEGSSSNMVDANLGVLKSRMEEVMKKEKLKYRTSKRMKNYGWSYNSISTDYKTRSTNGYAAMIIGTVEVVCLVGGSLGLVFLVGSLLIFLVSLMVHFYT